MLANKLGYLYIDTGAMYRAITYTALQKGVPLADEEALLALTLGTIIKMIPKDGEQQKIFCNGLDVTEIIREPLINKNVSQVAAYGKVRQELVRMQRELAREQNVVMDGRDAGTVILPRAECKIFLIASLAERAKRRYLELRERGYQQDFSLVKTDLANRDHYDANRKASPLMPAEDAVTVDTTHLNPTEVVQEILTIIKNKRI